MSLTKDERLNLKKMMGEMDYQDNTDMIRRVKHSVKIRNNIRRMEDLKREYTSFYVNNLLNNFLILSMLNANFYMIITWIFSHVL